MEKFIIKYWGCPTRQLDAEKIRNFFVANGLEQAVSPEEADYIVAVTCGLTEIVKEQAIAAICDFQKFKGKLLVYGCLSAMDPERLKSVYNGNTLITKDIERLDTFFDFPVKFKAIPDATNVIQQPGYSLAGDFKKIATLNKGTIILKIAKEANRRLSSFSRKNEIEGLLNGIGFNNKFSALRISEGCLGNCSYCQIKKAIGKIKSKPMPVILTELRKLLSKKQYRINIASNDSGAYGLDIGLNFPELLSAILKENEKIIIEYIQDMHPRWIILYKEEMVILVKTKRIKSILIPSQSGNKRILKLMNRPSNLEELNEVINRMKEVYPYLRLRTQIIAGFPTETEEEFKDTMDFIKNSKFDEVDIFAYHEVKGSDSENITPKIPREVILKRIKKFREDISIPGRTE